MDMLSRTIFVLLRDFSSWPSMYTCPLLGSSRKFMQRTVVDLPEPEGPMMTSFSPSLTSRSTSLSTCSSPKYLLTFSSRIMSARSFRHQPYTPKCTAESAAALP